MCFLCVYKQKTAYEMRISDWSSYVCSSDHAVSINNGTWMAMYVPFGGFKQSGIGRQYGRQGFEEYLEIKVLGMPSGEKATTLAWGEVDSDTKVGEAA